MSWALQFDGVNDYLNVPGSPMLHAWSGRTEYEYEIDLILPTGGTNVHLVGRNEDLAGSLRVTPTGIRLRYGAAGSTEYFIPGTIPFDDASHKLNISRNPVGTIHELTVDGVSAGTLVNAAAGVGYFADKIGKASGTITQALQLQAIQFRTTIGGANLYYWDADASSHSSGNPTLLETVASKNGSGVGMPTDGSAWVFLGVAGVISQTTQSFTQSLTGLVVTGVEGSINQSTPSFTQAALGTSSLPVTGNITQTTSAFTMSAIGASYPLWTNKPPVSTVWTNKL